MNNAKVTLGKLSAPAEGAFL